LKAGKVYLVGAGPGDPGLITQKGLECLKRAEVVVYDHLLDEGLLESAPSKAEKIYAGKSASRHALEQDQINQLLVDKAKEGKMVVRLKGGDPFVLGRGGEEAEVLVDNQINFEIVPGISSSIAVPAYAGIPVTHRDSASSFAVITGHEDPTKDDSSLKWDKLATGVDTLVFLMGMANLPNIAAKLIENGRSAETPVAVIKDGTRPQQKVVSGTLTDIVEKAKEAKLGPPSIIVVGEVVRLWEKLRWFDNRPLCGKRILVTRSRQQASSLSRLLTDKGAEPIELPAIDIKPLKDTSDLDSAIHNMPRYRWILFTSVNGVDAFFERLRSQNLDSRHLSFTIIGAIGPATAEALARWGILADYCPPIYTTEAMLKGLESLGVAGEHFLLPRADIADKELTDGLKKLKAIVHEVAAYQTQAVEGNTEKVKKMLSEGEIEVVTFASSSTVTNLVKSLGAVSLLKGVKIAVIGPKTAQTAIEAGLEVDILAREQTIPGLVEAIIEYFASTP
jgi:uroporphyrinogen III methyltransferase / synthase